MWISRLTLAIMRDAHHRLRLDHQANMNRDVTDFRMYPLDERDVIRIEINNGAIVDCHVFAMVCLEQFGKQSQKCLMFALPLALRKRR